MFPIHKLNCLQHFFSVLNPITYHSNQITFTQLGVEVSVFKVNKLLSFVYNSCFLKTNFSALSQFWKRVIVQADTMSNKKKMFRKRKKMVTQKPIWQKIIKWTLLLILGVILVQDLSFEVPTFVFREFHQERITAARCLGFVKQGNTL